MKRFLLNSLLLLSSVCGLLAADFPDPLADLRSSGAEWGIWIENGLVNPGEAVRLTVSVPLATPSANLPPALTIHPRYLETASTPVETVVLNWQKVAAQNQWQARVSYRPRQAGNYYASIPFCGHELFSYFAAWKPGLTAINFWVDMPVEYHDAGDLDDLYLPEVESGHLPFDYELVLVGEKVFSPEWLPRDLFRHAQVEAGAEVVPFLDGGYFHKLDPEFTARFEQITNTLPADYAANVSPETRAVHGLRMLSDPTFHSLTVAQCSAVIAGARRYWHDWGFHPFTGVATYSPSDTLVESCRQQGLKWISGVFADYDFTDGTERWQVGWRQKHRGMPSFPYLISPTDFRWTGHADDQSTMMFPGWQNLPIWDHEDRHEHGTDPGSYRGYAGLSPGERMLRYSAVFERDNRLAQNAFPLAVTFCIQMNNPDNHALLQGLIDRAQGNLIFIHKRYLQTYYREHHIRQNPDIGYEIPDYEFAAGRSSAYSFSDEAVWEGADGKAAFISQTTAPLEKGRSIHLPVWWYDFRHAAPLSPQTNLPSVDLSGVSLDVGRVGGRTALIIQSPQAFTGLPICLWELTAGHDQNASWIKSHRALRLAAPETLGKNQFMWLIRPDIHAGKNVIPLDE